MAIFIQSEEVEETCDRLRDFVRQPCNWYRVGQVNWVPGDREEYVLDLQGIRVVLSVTQVSEMIRPFLHMTVSVSSGKYPHPLIVWNIAHLLGFTGATTNGEMVVAPGPWTMSLDEQQHCVVIQQPLEDA